MLKLTLPAVGEEVLAVTLQLEHSLVSLSKWEAIHEKPFFSREQKTQEETLSYIEQMIVEGNAPVDFSDRLTSANVTALNEYINSKQSATFFREEGPAKPNNEITTSELIYYWMIQFQIPPNYETWHLNRLMNLIRICGIKQTKPKPMGRQQQAEEYRRLNEERRAKLGTSG